jgi:hypothetical protein
MRGCSGGVVRSGRDVGEPLLGDMSFPLLNTGNGCSISKVPKLEQCGAQLAETIS